jgi:protein phosphatase
MNSPGRTTNPATVAADVSIDAFGLTHVGRVRKANEDHFAIVSLRKALQIRQTSLADAAIVEAIRVPEALLFVVADGVGGRPGGAQASSTAVTALVEYLGEAAGCFNSFDVEREHEFLEQLESGVHRAHDRIVADYENEQQRPATTLTMATLVWPRAYLVHVGDSRAIYLRKGRLRQLTRDQTFGELMVEAGAWTEDQAKRSPAGGALASAVGASDLTPSIGLVDLEAGDVMLFCTDGLTRHVTEDRITEVLQTSPDAEEACRRLVDAALDDGGTDNVTVIVARAVQGNARA